MSAPAAPQRYYRAPCPACGAPVEFKSAQSAYAVCAYCHSTVVREGDALKRIGKMAELFDDHSPLQLGAAGQIDGQGFQLVGRLQYKYAQGTWNEWHALMASGRIQLDGKDVPFTLIGRLQYKGDAGVWTEWAAFLNDGTLATLGEDNGAYVFTRPIDPGRDLQTLKTQDEMMGSLLDVKA